MDRRQLLAGIGAAIGVAFGGCLDDNALSSDPNDNDSSNPSDSNGPNGENDDAPSGSDGVSEAPRTDEPPHEIDQPEPPDDHGDGDEWNENFLGEQMEREPALSFEPIDVNRRWIRESAFEETEWDDGDSYHVETVTDEESFEDVFDEEEMEDVKATNDDVRKQLREVDFDDVALVLVESGFGSGSVGHRWARVEDEEGGV